MDKHYRVLSACVLAGFLIACAGPGPTDVPSTATRDASPTPTGTRPPDATATPRPVEPTSYLGIPPPGAIRRLGLGSIESIAVSPDGTRLAVGTTAGLYLYDALTFELLWFHGSQKYFVGGLNFSLDGRLLGGYEANRVYVWDVENGNQIFDQPVQTLMESILISPDGQTVIANGHAQYIWSLETGEELAMFDTPGSGSRPGRLSPTGEWMALQNEAGEAVLHDLRDDTVHVLEGDRGHHFVFSPDGRSLASGSNELNIITIWDVRSQTRHKDFQIRKGMVPVAFTPDGNQLLMQSLRDGIVEVWDVQIPRLTAAITGSDVDGWLTAISPRGEVLDANNRRVRVYRLPDGALERTLEGFNAPLIYEMASASEGRVALHYREFVEIRDTETGQPLVEMLVNDEWRWAVSPDGSRMAVLDLRTDDVIIWDLERVEPLLTHALDEAVYSHVGELSFLRDGQTLAVGHGFDGIELIDANTGEILRTFPDLQLESAAQVSLDDSSFIARLRGVPGVRDIDTGGLLYELPVESYTWPRFDISPDQRSIAIPEYEEISSRIVVKDIESQVVLWANTYAGTANSITHVVYSPDGTLLVLGRFEGDIQILDAQTGDTITQYYHSGLSDLVFSPDGLWLASSSFDGTVILWDVPY